MKTKILFLIAVLFSSSFLLPKTTEGQCNISGFSYKGSFNGHHYYLSNNGTNPSIAYNIVHGYGGYMASLTSHAENVWLSSQIPAYITIGLNDVANEGTYVWDSGEPYSYSNWWFGEPNNSGDEDYTVTNFNALARWNDVPNWVAPQFVMEFEDQDNDGIGDYCDPCDSAIGGISNFNESTCNCNPGFFALTTEINGHTVITGCSLCPVGTYCPGDNNSYPCAAGSYSSEEGASACNACPQGTYSDIIGAAYCISCPMGRYSSVVGATSCSLCPQGTFSDVIGAIYCASCPVGSFSNIEGASSCVLCPSGTYNDVIGAVECQNCGQGYNSYVGSTACFADADGDFIDDNTDNCVNDANSDQADNDNDGVGNVCDNCLIDENSDQADADCDGVGDACDVCDGGDDTIDNNHDGLPDCKYPPAYVDIIDAWKCANNKVLLCKIPPGNPNGAHTICVNKNSIMSHINSGSYLGPCGDANCLEGRSKGSNEIIFNDDAQFAFTPNPAYDNIQLWMSKGLSGIQIMIFDLQGKLMLKKSLADGTTEYLLDLSQISNGSYLIKIGSHQGVYSEKLMVIK